MKLNPLKFSIILFSLIFGLVVILIIFLPLFLTPLIQKYTPQIETAAKEAGIELKLEELSANITPKLNIEIKANTITAKNIAVVKNAGVSIKILPLLHKNIEFGEIYAKNADINLIGKFDFLTQKEGQQQAELPYGIKISTNLPDIKVDKYKLGLDNIYYIEGKNFIISDFVLNKKLKLTTSGKIIFSNSDISNYDIKFSYGKKPLVNVKLNSKAKLTDLLKFANKIALYFGIKDLETLSATGAIDADFQINSDLKTVSSSGYLKILPSNVKYGLYKIAVNNITADINFDNNNINIKNAKFTTFGYPFNLSGSISHDALANLKLTTKNILVKFAMNLAKPDLNLSVSVPQNVSFPIPYMGNSNMTFSGAVDITGTIQSPKLKGIIKLPDISIKDMNFALTNTVFNFDGSGIAGNASAQKLKFDNIIGNNLSSKFSLKDFNFVTLSDINSTFWNGNITGEILYNIAKMSTEIDVKGKNLNSTDAVFATTLIPKALTGLLDFGAKLTTSGATDVDIIKNLKGDINFEINNGRFVSIGKIENIVQAQNIASISLLKSAISALTSASTLQQTDKFDIIKGELTLSKGQANISHIKVTGPLMSYHIKGNYNILPNTAYLVILGRLDAKTVALLGPLGQLSADKLLSYIPKFGAATAQYLKQLTADPANEDTSLIPALSTGSKEYKDFKVIFNGSVDKASSIKSFKWLSVCDTTQMSIKDDLKNASKAVKENINSQVDSTKKTVNAVKTNVTNAANKTVEKAKNETTSAKQTVEDIKNIDTKQTVKNLGSLLKNAAVNANKQMEIPQQESDATTVEE